VRSPELSEHRLTFQQQLVRLCEVAFQDGNGCQVARRKGEVSPFSELAPDGQSFLDQRNRCSGVGFAPLSQAEQVTLRRWSARAMSQRSSTSRLNARLRWWKSSDASRSPSPQATIPSRFRQRAMPRWSVSRSERGSAWSRNHRPFGQAKEVGRVLLVLLEFLDRVHAQAGTLGHRLLGEAESEAMAAQQLSPEAQTRGVDDVDAICRRCSECCRVIALASPRSDTTSWSVRLIQPAAMGHSAWGDGRGWHSAVRPSTLCAAGSNC